MAKFKNNKYSLSFHVFMLRINFEGISDALRS